MKPRVGVVQFGASCPEGNEHPLARGVTWELARRLTSVGGVDANPILLGNRERLEAGVGVDVATDPAPLGEGGGGLSVPSLGARYESDYIVVGEVRVADGLLLFHRVYEAASGRLIHEGCATGLRSDVFRLVENVVQEVRTALGFFGTEDEDEEINPVFERLEFEAFTEYCLARESDRPANALDHLERAVTIEPSFRIALVEYVSTCYQVDELGASLPLLDAYLERNPHDQDLRIAAANLCLAFHRVDEGVRFASRALEARPDDVEPRVLMARFLFAREMPAEATVHLEAALRSSDASADASYCLGRYFLDLGDFYRARDYFERCLGTDPGYVVALRDLQCCYYELGDFPQAIEACEQLLETDPSDAGSHYNLGLVYQRLGRVHLAAKYFEESIRQDPAFFKAIFMLGEYLLAAGRDEEALARYREAHRVAPRSAEALGRIGDCHARSGRTREAYRHYVWARREDPLWENARFHLIEGAALAAEGDLHGARQRLLKATELDDSLADAWNELGWVLLRARRPEEALDAVRHACDLEPEHPSVLENVLACTARLPLGLRISGWVRRLRRDARERLRRLRALGVVPCDTARRRVRRFPRSLTWYGLRG